MLSDFWSTVLDPAKPFGMNPVVWDIVSNVVLASFVGTVFALVFQRLEDRRLEKLYAPVRTQIYDSIAEQFIGPLVDFLQKHGKEIIKSDENYLIVPELTYSLHNTPYAEFHDVVRDLVQSRCPQRQLSALQKWFRRRSPGGWVTINPAYSHTVAGVRLSSLDYIWQKRVEEVRNAFPRLDRRAQASQVGVMKLNPTQKTDFVIQGREIFFVLGYSKMSKNDLERMLLALSAEHKPDLDKLIDWTKGDSGVRIRVFEPENPDQ